jgi:hypothetical protein
VALAFFGCFFGAGGSAGSGLSGGARLSHTSPLAPNTSLLNCDRFKGFRVPSFFFLRMSHDTTWNRFFRGRRADLLKRKRLLFYDNPACVYNLATRFDRRF